MARLEFEPLRADEIDIRASMVDPQGKYAKFLLYKDARVDMNRLDEHKDIGPLNWKRHHEFKEGQSYCTISVWDKEKKEWVSKEDVGTKNKGNNENEKTMSSDSFKRAGTNWGIGRELYTAPNIFIGGDKFKDIKKDTLKVSEIEYTNKTITYLTIFNLTTEKTIFTFGTLSNKPNDEPEQEYICSQCKNVIESGLGHNGVYYTAEQKYKMGKGICSDCYKKNKEKEKKDE